MDDSENKNSFRKIKSSNLHPLPEEDPAEVNYSSPE
jgi:hypothetical protein